MSDLKIRLDQLRKELNNSIKAATGNCNKAALENFTDDLKELDNIIRDLANGVPASDSGLHLQRVRSCCLDPNNRKFKNSENGIEWYCAECSKAIAP